MTSDKKNAKAISLLKFDFKVGLFHTLNFKIGETYFFNGKLFFLNEEYQL
jgi:hypothetical protein